MTEMKGNVISFEVDTNRGAISGHDGNRYEFVRLEWRGESQPHRGDIVEFHPADQSATNIVLLDPVYLPLSFVQFYFLPAGRIPRWQYWIKYFLPAFLIALLLKLPETFGGNRFGWVYPIFSLLIIWPSMAVLAKRIHDRNKPGWLVWLLYGPSFLLGILSGLATRYPSFWLDFSKTMVSLLIALIVIWFFIEFGCLRGTVGPNKYGPDPVR
jgi:uncharacterized membrane protein YhaH (DUF805 family)